MSGFTIRSATPDDAGAIAGVHVQSWRETYRGLLPDAMIDDWTVQKRAERWRGILSPPAPTPHAHVATLRDGTVTGFISGGPAREATPGFGHEVYAIYSLKAHQRRGAGRGLFNALVADILRDGGSSLYLWAFTGNPTCGFYERMGGRTVKTEQTVRGGMEIEETMYAWPELAL